MLPRVTSKSSDGEKENFFSSGRMASLDLPLSWIDKYKISIMIAVHGCLDFSTILYFQYFVCDFSIFTKSSMYSVCIKPYTLISVFP